MRDEGRRRLKAPRRRARQALSEPQGRGAAWTEERGMSDEGRAVPHERPEASEADNRAPGLRSESR